MQLNFSAREVTIKLVYYGPALSGKTTNLKSLHDLTSEQSRGRLMTLETKDDRTLFFDMLPLVFKADDEGMSHAGGTMSLRLKVFTVPGQVAGDALLCRMPCVGGDGAIDCLAFPTLCGHGRPLGELRELASRLLREPKFYSATVAASQEAARTQVSYAVVAAQLDSFFRRVGDRRLTKR